MRMSCEQITHSESSVVNTAGNIDGSCKNQLGDKPLQN